MASACASSTIAAVAFSSSPRQVHSYPSAFQELLWDLVVTWIATCAKQLVYTHTHTLDIQKQTCFKVLDINMIGIRFFYFFWWTQTTKNYRKPYTYLLDCAVFVTNVSSALYTYSSQKNGSILGATKASFLSGRKLRVSRYTSPAGARSLTRCAAANPDRPLWFPGSTPPPWLDGRFDGKHIFSPSWSCSLWIFCSVLIILINTVMQPPRRLWLWSSGSG